MHSHGTKRFWDAFERLPRHIQDRAREAFKIWQANPNHPSLKFKQIHPGKPIYSVRIGLGWRAIGVKVENTVIWFWIGSHSDYTRVVNRS